MYMFHINVDYTYCVPVPNDSYISADRLLSRVYSPSNEVSNNGVAASQHSSSSSSFPTFMWGRCVL